ncbi:MAG: hypothetical protein U0610_07160 [bacterium]
MRRGVYAAALVVALAMVSGCCAWFCDGTCAQGAKCRTDEECGGMSFCRLSGSVTGAYTQIDCNPGPTVNVSGGKYNCDTSTGPVTIQGLPGGSVKNCTCSGSASTCNYP